MSRQLDLQLYLALNGYSLEKIPEERFDDYMREYHYTTDTDAMLILVRKLKKLGFDFTMCNIGDSYYAAIMRSGKITSDLADTLSMALSKVVYKFYSGKEWEAGR